MNPCSSCHKTDLKEILFLGYLPLPNVMRPIGSEPTPETVYPLQLVQCEYCKLVQLGQSLPKELVFPQDYSYRSGTTKELRDNFKDLVEQCKPYLNPASEPYNAAWMAGLDGRGKNDLVIDIGANDGTLLLLFKDLGYSVFGFEPTDAANGMLKHEIPHSKNFFTKGEANHLLAFKRKAKVITACNVFAHVPDVHDFLEGVELLLDDDGVFVIEVQYLGDLQFDTIYAEHIRYFSMESLINMMCMEHGWKLIKAQPIPTHGGSFRTFWNRKPFKGICLDMNEDQDHRIHDLMKDLKTDTLFGKINILSLIRGLKMIENPKKIYGIGLPSRAVTLINYCGLGDILDCIVEIDGSPKIGNYCPGTRIPVVAESTIKEEPDYWLLNSWHLADTLVPRLREKGFTKPIIIPLPTPRILS